MYSDAQQINIKIVMCQFVPNYVSPMQILFEFVYSWESYHKNNKMLSYRRETALQGAL